VSTPLWTVDEFVAATHGRPIGTAPETITGISIDSRTIANGEAFFAIRGEQHDGHDFVTMAFAKGAATAVVAEDRVASLGRVKGSLTVVPDVLAALADLGRAARARCRSGIAAITGSVGKTGTKEMLAAALAVDGRTHSSPASFNNHWGVPLSLARMPRETRFGVFEIGMNHAGEITPLARLVHPQVAVITTVEAVHLEYFEDVEGVARAKAEIFVGVAAGGTAIINRDNPHYELLAALARDAGIERVLGFGESTGAELHLEKVKLKPDCSCVSARILGDEVSYKLAIPGRHIVQNSLAVLGAVSVLGADLARAALALADVVPSRGRGSRHDFAIGVTLIDESYNANPASMRAAIAVLGGMELARGGRRIAILGDMRELGTNAAAMHAGLAAPLAEARIDRVFLAGPLMRSLWEVLPAHQRGGYAATAAELEPTVATAIAAGDVVMVKGSNASRMVTLVEALKARFAPARAAVEARQAQDVA
jgi:UDP-N-acetylmuramoyl-tripeptide--D-alanyl-D-alanine ligase